MSIRSASDGGRWQHRGMQVICTLVLLFTFAIGNVLANQTDLISGKTLPDMPTASLNMATQSTFTPDANGWIVFDPYAEVANLSTIPSWWGHTAKATQGQAFAEADLETLSPTAPFVTKSTNHFRINTGNAAAIRFTGAESISVLVHPRSNSSGKEICATLFSYDSGATPAQVKVGDEKKTSSKDFHEFLFNGLTTSSTYVLYVYNNGTSQNGCLCEIAIKAPVNTDGPFAVTYDKNNEGASGTVTDANSPYAKDATVTVLGNSFTAPTGMVFAGWNTKADGSGTSYAAGNTFDAVKDVTLYAQWAYPATGTGTITYTLTKGKADVSAEVSGVSTLSSSSTAFSVSTLAIGSNNAQDGYSGQITGHAADYSASQYVALQFTVADGYTFTPSAVSMKVFANSTSNMKMKLVFTDGVTSVESEELACESSADSDIEFASGAFTGKKFVGNVDVVLYQWGVASKRTYVKSPVTITGTVATEAPKYDVEFSNGGEGTGSMATLKYEAGEQVTLPDCGYTPASGREFDGWTSSDVTISAGKFTMPSKNVTITATWRDEAVKYTVTYDVNGGSSATPTETDKAAGDEFALAAAPEYDGYHFEGWLCNADAVTYDAEDAYTMTAANTTFTAQWKPYSTISIANKTYIIGSGNFNAVSDFSSNSDGEVTYALKEAYTGVTLSSAGVFSATVAGDYIVVANQAANATYAATSKEFTVTVLDNELSDTYVWKKGTGYTGCIANPNADAPAAQYTDIAYEGFTGMGRAAADNTECILTFSVKAAYSANFGIKSICTYGKLEEPAGGQISWDGGTNWENLAAYSEGKKEFNAPSATFPTSFKIRFLGVSASSGGLYWRNALVTLEVKKTVSGVTEALVGVEVNGEAISAANLSTLQEDKTLDIATAYAAAPTVTFKKQVTTSYEGGWAPDVTNVDVEVTASDNTTAWQASASINAQAYTINLAKPAGPSLETEATAFTLTSAKVATDTKKFTFSGVNLTSGNVTISLESPVAGMTVSPAEVTPTAGAITDQEVTITYKSLEAVAETNVNLVVYYDADTKITIPLTYSSTVGYEDLTPISAATTWNWTNAADAEYGTLGQSDIIVLANADAVWDEGFDARAIAGALQYYYRGNSYAQGNSLKFNTTIPGKVYVKFSNTGGKDIARAPRITDVNGTYAPEDESEGSKNTTAKWYNHSVAAGDVLIEGFEMKEPIALNMLRYYEVRFAPIFAVTYDAGEGSVKGGETMPTQADEAAGEKIVLAAANALEKDGYDFAGWLCNIDAQTYQPGDEYTMTAAATTFTAQWVEHVDPVDPTLTYDNGAYTIGLAALDLSSLITAQTSTGAITYSVKTDGGTGATVDGKNFTAATAGTATITASQAAVLGYNAITVDFNVEVTEATEIDGIKLVEAGALTGNFVTARTLSNGENTVEGIAYTKYLTMSSTMTSFGNEVAPSATKGIYYYPSHKNIRFYFYVYNNQSSAKKIYIYTVDEDAESTSDATSANVSVDAGRHMVYADVELTKHAAVVFGVENTGTQICQIVAVESGDALLQGGEAGYSIDYNKCYISPKAGTVAVYDGIEYKLYADAKLVSAGNVQLQTLGTHYIKFHLDAPMTVNVYADNKKYYIGSECSTDDAAMLYDATGDGEFSLAAGDWYINGSGAQVKINKLSFSLPKCAEPSFDALANSDICEGNPYVALDGTATITDAGTVTYKWYAEGADESDPAAVLGTDATYTPSADGKYYVIATNSLSGYSDNVKKSDLVSVTHFASAAITTAPENVRMDAGQNATLTVAATGKNLSYEWFTCDDAEGTNPVAIVPAETGASLTVTVTAGMYQYYKVVVSSDCGDAFAVARVEEWSALPQVSVSATTTWDWQYAATTTIAPEKDVEILMANIKDGVKKMTNDETFNSQALLFKGQEAYIVENSRAFAKGGHIKFTTTVPGMVTVEFSDNGNNNRKLKINDAISPESSSSKTDVKTFSAIVPAGEVMLEGVNEDGTGNDRYIRISKIIFDANPDPAGADYTRDVTEGRYGTICLPKAGVMVGADIFEIAYYGESTQKVFLDNIINGEMEAGRPYIFLPKEGATQLAVFYTDEANASAGSHNGLIGFIGDAADEYFNIPAGEGNYILQNNLYREVLAGAQARILSNRAYIKLSAINPHETALAPGRRRISMSVYSEQIATGIENTGFESEAPRKVLINGELYILRGEKMYDAKGQLVK